MSHPTSYTEKTLAEYMAAELGKLAAVLGYAVGVGDAGSYQEAVNNSLLAYGVTSVADATDITKIRALARVEAWRKALNDLSALYKFSADGASYEREQMFSMAEKNLSRALTLALAWDVEYQITVTRVRDVHDPYKYLPEEDFIL